MSVKSITTVSDERLKKLHLVMFRQYDGEPCKHGLELAEFLSTLKIVEGLGIDNYRVANGAADLAAQIVVRFKKGPGQVYLYTSLGYYDQSYSYNVSVLGSSIRVTVSNYDGSILFRGTVDKFHKFCKLGVDNDSTV